MQMILGPGNVLTGSLLLQFTVKITSTDCCTVNATSSGAEAVNVGCQYHVHVTDPDLHRVIAFIENSKSCKG